MEGAKHYGDMHLDATTIKYGKRVSVTKLFSYHSKCFSSHYLIT